MPSPPPEWVKALTPSSPQGTDLLKQERAQSNVEVDKLAEFLHTKAFLEKQQRFLELLSSEKVFDKSQMHSQGRPERIQRALAKGKRLQQLKEKYNWSTEDYHFASEMIGEPTPYGLHASMFLVRDRLRDTAGLALIVLCYR